MAHVRVQCLVSLSLSRLKNYSTLSITASQLKGLTENITGHSEVLEAQQLVQKQKEDLRNWRNKLSSAADSYEDVQQRLKALYARKTQLYQNQRRDLAALQVINNEEETLLYEEQSLHTDVETCKLKERESFDNLSDAILKSHEKERAQSDKMKYYSRLGSIVGAFFGFLGSNMFLKREIRKHNTIQADNMSSVTASLQKLTTEWKKTASPVAAVDAQDAGEGPNDVAKKYQEMIVNVAVSLEDLKQCLRSTDMRMGQLCTDIQKNAKLLNDVSSRVQAHKRLPPVSVVNRPSNSSERKTLDQTVMLGVALYSVILAASSLFK